MSQSSITRRSVLASSARLALYGATLSPLSRGFVATAQAAEPKPWFLQYQIGGGTLYRCSPCVGAGTKYTLTPYYQSLEPLKKEMLFIQGIKNKAFIDWNEGDDGGHEAGATGLCGRAPMEPRGVIQHGGPPQFVGGPTFDRTLAESLSAGLPFPSIDFAVGNDFGSPLGRFLFWRGPGQPVTQFKEPLKAFSRLFGGAIKRGFDAATEEKVEDLILDSVKTQLAAAQGLVGAEGKKTMDANLTALSEFRQNNRRLQQKLKDMSIDSSFIKPVVDAAGKPIPTTDSRAFPELLKQFTELSAIVLDLGLTRVVTLQLGDSYGTNFTFPFLNGRDKLTFEGDLHFTYGHDFSDKIPHRLVIENWFCEVFVDIVNRLRKNTSATLASGLALLHHQMEHSPHHRVGLLPAVMAGGANGRVKPGQLLNLFGARTKGGDFLPEYDESKTRTTNELFLTVARALGVKVDVLGEARYCTNGPMTELLSA
jgi:Protein of unknown function (DUF1552)